MKILLIVSVLISFLSSLILVPYWIKKALHAGISGKDVNKFNKPRIAEAGGIIVIASFLAGVFAYIAVKTFYFKSMQYVNEILALTSAILIITFIGFIDDILGWKIGLRQYQKPILCLLAAIPLAAINIGQSIITLPFVGELNLGILFPLLLVPIAITGAANGFNMLAGYNGLEAGLGFIILSTLGLLAWNSETSWVTLIAFCAAAALLAFLYYNKHPAKVFPGNTLTYGIGALIAAIAIMGNTEKAALILFIPYFIELVLKARGKMRKESFALSHKDNSLSIKEGVYGVEHIAIKILNKIKPSHKVSEKDVVFFIFGIEIILSIITILLYLKR